MPPTTIENPILNSPFAEPMRHFKFDDDGITSEIAEGRRRSTYFIPIAKPKVKGGAQLSLPGDWVGERMTDNDFINRVREQVTAWRSARYAGITAVTRELLAYWQAPDREKLLFFCQLEAVETAIFLAEVAGNRWTEVQFIEDAGFSGGSLARPGLAAALEALRQRRADTLVVSKLDRLSRSLVDFAGLMARASREHWALVALDLGVDTTTPTGEMVANVMATFAQFERRLIGQRTKEALAEKRRAGVQLGRPATLPNEVSARIAKAYRSGQTLRAIADALTAEAVPTAQGGRRWHASTVRAILARVGEERRPRRPRPRR